MKNQFSGERKSLHQSIAASDAVSDASRERRLLEVKRRFEGLQIRRDHLERELQAVKNCLISLDRQMEKDSFYKQLFIGNQS